MNTMGPVEIEGVIPNGTDFRGVLKPKAARVSEALPVSLDDYVMPAEDLFVEWLAAHRQELNGRLRAGGISLLQAIGQGLAKQGRQQDLGCLIAALTSPNEWVSAPDVRATFDESLVISHFPTLSFMSSDIRLQLAAETSPEPDSANDTL